MAKESSTEKNSSAPNPPEADHRSRRSFLSAAALDPPLVAILWWRLFAQSFENDGVRWETGLALAFTVWAIYAADRLFDVKRATLFVPRRKILTPGRTRMLWSILVLAAAGGVFFGCQILGETAMETALIALLTTIYFFVFRRLQTRTSLPLKEILIGICFAAGVAIPFWRPLPNWNEISALAIFGLLCTVNCLIISLAEADFDRVTDPAAWFAGENNCFPFRWALSAGAGAAVFLYAVEAIPATLSFALLASHILLFLTWKYHAVIRPSIQSACDAALWAPALLTVAL